MAVTYSDDLRRKLLEAHQRGKGSLEELAGWFGVSVGWAKKVSASLKRTGKMERPPGGRRGPVSKITAGIEKDLKVWIGKQSDLTLAELQLRLWEQRQLKVSLSLLWMALKRMNLRLKKSRYTPPNRIPGRAASSGRVGAKPAKKSTRNN